MKTYRIEMMAQGEYHKYMTGGYYGVKNVEIKAENVEQALAMAKANNPNLIAREDYIRTLEEIEMEQKEIEMAHKAEEEKQAKPKARKEEREKAKAEELGLTLEEYRAKVKHDKKIRVAENKIAQLKIELEKAEKYLENLKKRV